MRSVPIYLAVLVAVVLMGLGLKVFPFQGTSYASEIASQEIAKLNAAAPKFPRKPLLSSTVEAWVGRGHGSATQFAPNFFVTAGHVASVVKDNLVLKASDGSVRKGTVLWMNA